MNALLLSALMSVAPAQSATFIVPAVSSTTVCTFEAVNSILSNGWVLVGYTVSSDMTAVALDISGSAYLDDVVTPGKRFFVKTNNKGVRAALASATTYASAASPKTASVRLELAP